MKRILSSVAAIAACGMSFATVRAATVFGPGINNIIYHNYEDVFDSTGAQKTSTLNSPATLAVGDTLVGVLRIDGITYSGGGYFPSGGDEITGIFAQKIVAIQGSTVYFSAATLTSFHNGSDSFNTGLSGNEMFKFYQQSGGADFNAGVPTSTTLASSVATATNGSLLMSLGFVSDASPTTFTGDTGYFYSNLATDGSGHPQATSFGGLNFIVNNSGAAFSPIDDPGENFTGKPGGIFPVDMWTKSNISLDFRTGDPTLLNSPWDFISSDPAQINVPGVGATVPLPAAAWPGFAMLVGLGGMTWLKRRKMTARLL